MLNQMQIEGASPTGDFDLASAIAAIRAGDRSKLAEVMERYYPRVRLMVQSRLRMDFRRSNDWMLSAFSTSDVVQSVFLRVLSGAAELRASDEASLLAYLATVVHNQLLDVLRHHQADKRDARRDKKTESAVLEALSKPAPLETPPQHIAAREHIETLRSVLESQPKKQQLLWEMRAEDQLAFAEIAQRLGYASADAARMAFHDLRAKLLVALRQRGFTAEGTRS